MELDRVTFYGENSFAFNTDCEALKKRFKFLKDLSYEKLTLEDVLELDQISRYLPIILQDKIRLKADLSAIKSRIGKWFSSVPTSTVSSGIKDSKFSRQYQKSLWHLLASQKAPNLEIRDILKLYSGTKVVYPLQEQVIRARYGRDLTTIVMQDLRNIGLVLNPKLYDAELPEEFNQHQIETFLLNYIGSEAPNPNMLERVATSRSVNDSIRLKAQKKYQEIIVNVLKEEKANSLGIGTKVSINFTLDTLHLYKLHAEIEDNVNFANVEYNGLVLNELIDWPTILNNFIYIFGFIDNFGILTISSQVEDDGSLERAFRYESGSILNTGTSFQLKNQQALLSFVSYYRFLANRGIQLERVVEWFFSDYLASNFNVNGLSVNLPKGEEAPEIKALLAMTQLHRIVRMFDLLALDKDFDRGLVDNYSHTKNDFRDIGSSFKRKYGKIIDPDLLRCEGTLFSDQSPMPSKKERYFADLVLKENIKRSELDEYQSKLLDFLLEQKVLICADEIIRFRSFEVYQILKYDFKNDCIPVMEMHLQFKKHPILDDLFQKGKVRGITRLLTDREASVFNYYFSDFYANGLGLRNKYAHGAFNSFSEEKHQNNYMLTLMFMVMLIIKINAELDGMDRIGTNG
ncbi:hypothetical protein [Furfurilactobacillus curtus]|uniref:DUF4209 domain-containing protein n=1 Tax=Furfurilactobacillus curtus TaxID=1746200 RepID=A0ABQ5JLP8_9LACO